MPNNTKGTQSASGGTTASGPSAGMTANTMEQRVVAFAEQLGRLAATVQTKAEGWMDRDALSQQIASVRDGAAELLEQLRGSAAMPSESGPTAPAPALRASKGRSGGVVDAPGKKHRKPAPADPRVKVATSQAAKMRTAKTMVKSKRHRGRG